MELPKAGVEQKWETDETNEMDETDQIDETVVIFIHRGASPLRAGYGQLVRKGRWLLG